MKKLILPLLALTLAGTARADLTINQEIQSESGPTKEMKITMKVKDQKVRMDVGTDATMILDLKGGDMTSLMHAQKMILKIGRDKIDAVKKMAEAQNSGVKIDPPKATGKKETISGYACDEYEMTANGGKIDLWITKDLPAAEKAMAELAVIAAPNDPVQNALKNNNISGFPMKTVAEIPGMGKTTSTVVGISDKPLPDSEFAVPEGYKEVQIPAGMPGQ